MCMSAAMRETEHTGLSEPIRHRLDADALDEGLALLTKTVGACPIETLFEVYPEQAIRFSQGSLAAEAQVRVRIVLGEHSPQAAAQGQCIGLPDALPWDLDRAH